MIKNCHFTQMNETKYIHFGFLIDSEFFLNWNVKKEKKRIKNSEMTSFLTKMDFKFVECQVVGPLQEVYRTRNR